MFVPNGTQIIACAKPHPHHMTLSAHYSYEYKPMYLVALHLMLTNCAWQPMPATVKRGIDLHFVKSTLVSYTSSLKMSCATTISVLPHDTVPIV